MAPPRRGAVVDDSRSEASSGTREHKGKGRRGGNGAANRDAKGSSHAGGVTSAPGHGQHSDQAKVGCCCHKSFKLVLTPSHTDI